MIGRHKAETSDGKIVYFDKETLSLSLVLQEMLEDNGVEYAIPLPSIDRRTFLKVLEYCSYALEHPLSDIEKPLRSNNIYDIVPKWYGDFISKEVDDDFVQDIINAGL